MAEFKLPTEVVDLPSKGLVYPKDNPLSEGKVEVKYMTAKEEDILTNQSYIKKGIVLDKLLESVIVSKINLDDLIIGDKNAVLIATRILGYGSKYTFNYLGKSETVDLSKLDNKKVDLNNITEEKNEFNYTLESTGTKITYKILTGKDEKNIDKELAGFKKINPDNIPEISTRLKYIIVSIEGDTERKNINNFVDNYFLARDSRAFRQHIRNTQPDVNLLYTLESGEEVTIPIGMNFFWPDSGQFV